MGSLAQFLVFFRGKGRLPPGIGFDGADFGIFLGAVGLGIGFIGANSCIFPGAAAWPGRHAEGDQGVQGALEIHFGSGCKS